MRNKFLRTLGMLALVATLLPACTKDLDQTPDYSANAEVVFRDPAQIRQVLARLYATLAVSGQQGPAGMPDISGIDEGFSNYLRQYWSLQEVTTDEAIIGWNDGNLPNVNKMTWNADNEFVRALYDRIYYQISLCNEFIRQTTDSKLSDRGISGDAAGTVRKYRAEARFLRALSYFHAMDMFGGGPFATEDQDVGTVPSQKTRAEYFSFVESELNAIESEMLNPRAEYGRADKATLWTLQTKLYLNAQVYTGTARNAEAITAARKVLAAGYTLSPNYSHLFLADNDRSAARNEIIFPVTSDGVRTQTYGSMTFLTHAPVGGRMQPADFGINGGWAGLRARPNLVGLFLAPSQMPADVTDRRALFFTTGQRRAVDTLSAFSNGYAVTKYKNVTSTGVPGSGAQANGGSGDFIDTDFPMFRLADVQLMLAEALLRSGGSTTEALQLVNTVRTRSNAPALSSITLDGILDERGRELFWEGHRRTDLIRFGRYTGPLQFLWPFKGGDTRTGQQVDVTRNLFPIPNTARVANSNIQQNPGY
ncbi:RagB/SusD family nutrient uptake outer membrane protein [Hymenobacter saemangeumensis]|uniref:RagB/SusD family nutrient uptake outer membrane protein n=1 Tax=Hymenobacter saemangeumensis TaxID=1084522 RepID=A0ABP8IBR6_9BACT